MKKTFLAVVLLVLVTVVSFGCGNNNTVRFVSIGPVSGENMIYGTSAENGIKLAVKEANEKGGIMVDGVLKQISFSMVDDEASPTKSVPAFTSYANRMDVLLGPITSGAAIAVTAEAVKTGVPVVTPTATSDQVTLGANNNRSEYPNIFRACFNDSLQGVAMANLTQDLGYKNAGILYKSSDAYSTGLKEAFEKQAEKNGITVKSYDYGDATDFSALLSSVSADQQTCLFVPDYYETVASIITQFRKGGYTGVFLGADGWDGVLGKMTNNLSLLEDCYFSNHYAADSTDQNIKDFIAKYTEEFKEAPNSFAVLGYDAATIAIQAIEKAGTVDYAQVVEALTSGTFNCVTGTITFDENGNPVKNPVIMKFDTQNGTAVFHANGRAQ